MTGPRNPFATRNGKIILIEDLSLHERGTNCGCRCPACDGDFIARMGDVKAHHFAHGKDSCDEIIAYTTGLYKLIHQILREGTTFFVPPLIVSRNFPKGKVLDEESVAQYIKIVSENCKESNLKVISRGKNVAFDYAELSYDTKNHIQAIELSYLDRKMAIKIMPPDTVCKYAAKSHHKGMATLVLDFTDDADEIQSFNSEDFQEYLLSRKCGTKWIYNPLIATIYPALLEINKREFADYLNQKKKIDEERKATERERKKQLAIEREVAKQRAATEEKARDMSAYESIKDKFTQQNEPVIDCYGNRWIQCDKCGEIKRESAFWIHGGVNRKNLGSCKECNKTRWDVSSRK